MKPQDKGAWKLCCMYSVVLDHNGDDADSRWLLGSASLPSESLGWPISLTIKIVCNTIIWTQGEIYLGRSKGQDFGTDVPVLRSKFRIFQNGEYKIK